MTPAVQQALGEATRRLAAAGVPEPRADAEVLLAHALGTDRVGVIVRATDAMDPAAAERFEALMARREAREPVGYIVGRREFWSLPLGVDRRVLIPRPETELVVETALRVAPRARRILDVGTGSGAIALALARELPAAEVVATDRMAPALAAAAENRDRLGPRVRLVRADLVQAFRDGAFDLVVSNPPYCAEGTVLQAEVRDWEPRSALYAGPDGLGVLRRLVRDAGRVLAPRGWLVMEMGIGQADAITERIGADGRYENVAVRCDPAGIDRVIAAQRRSGR
ncbi:MAG TPA: peptide chain release factor N(5)-glutamine methyltransferase [Candidatus Eisenbacteria bacterium]|nr:peptide chain release factor N(5)-glutamine methyltransferase [Candidatus Eisenbacteria bacterium]